MTNIVVQSKRFFFRALILAAHVLTGCASTQDLGDHGPDVTSDAGTDGIDGASEPETEGPDGAPKPPVKDAGKKDAAHAHDATADANTSNPGQLPKCGPLSAACVLDTDCCSGGVCTNGRCQLVSGCNNQNVCSGTSVCCGAFPFCTNDGLNQLRCRGWCGQRFADCVDSTDCCEDNYCQRFLGSAKGTCVTKPAAGASDDTGRTCIPCDNGTACFFGECLGGYCYAPCGKDGACAAGTECAFVGDKALCAPTTACP